MSTEAGLYFMLIISIFSPGFKDSSDEKSTANLVQIKGRFSVTSENVDLVKVCHFC